MENVKTEGQGAEWTSLDRETVPILTLSADKRFDLMVLIQIVGLARTGELKTDRLGELETTLRAFEFYEEAHRADLR